MNANVRILAIGTAVLLSACSSNEPTADINNRSLMARTVDDVTYIADTRVMESFPVQLRSYVVVENRTSEEVSITMPDGCEVFLRAYRTADRSGEPAWDESRVAVCTLALQQITLAAGETIEFTGSTISASQILGDSLPAGRYYFSALVRPDGQAVELEAGEAELAQ